MDNKHISAVIVLILLFIAGALIFLTAYFNLPNNIKDITIIKNIDSPQFTGETIFEPLSDEKLIYENIRFQNKMISYNVDDECSVNNKAKIRNAFLILTENSDLSFFEVNGQADIQVDCFIDVIGNENDKVIGEGGPISILNTSKYSLINSGSVKLYAEDTCSYPLLELHEILHVLGFKHSLDKNSLMFNVSDCNQRLDQDNIDNINNLYKDPILPDLEIKDLKVNVSSANLNFEIKILNIGLSQSEDTNVSIFEDGKFISSYNLGKLSIGSGKIISNDNVKLNQNTKEITFIVDYENKLDEINKENNKKAIIL